MSDGFVIEFRFDNEGTMYAGAHQGGLGFAPTVATALRFDTAEEAGRTAANGYGDTLAVLAHIVPLAEVKS